MIPANARITWPTLCVFGDSIVHGELDAEGGGWVDRLKNDYAHQIPAKISVYNLGVSGDRLAEVAKRFEVEAAARNPKTIIFAVGANDLGAAGIDATPPEHFEAQYIDLIVKARAYTKQILMLTILNVHDNQGSHGLMNEQVLSYNKIIRKVATACEIELLDFFGMIDSDQLVDGVHPGTRGHNNLNRWIQEELTRLSWDV